MTNEELIKDLQEDKSSEASELNSKIFKKYVPSIILGIIIAVLWKVIPSKYFWPLVIIGILVYLFKKKIFKKSVNLDKSE